MASEKKEEAKAVPEPVREGEAEILPIASNEVFYNPVQVFNRDLSTVALTTYLKLRKEGGIYKGKRKPAPGAEEQPVRVLEALAASGLRSIRYAKEVPYDIHCVANDLSAQAVEHMKKNVEHNKAGDKVTPNHGDANFHMYKAAFGELPKYHVIDLDPYGSASPFLDATVQAVEDGGFLCITSTDSPVLCGNHPELAFTRYGGTPLKQGGYHHEMSIRLLLNSIISTAAKYKRAVVPLLSLSIDFYYRVFVQIRDQPVLTKSNILSTSLVLQCSSCESFHMAPMGQTGKKKDVYRAGSLPEAAPGKCRECGSQILIGGPVYSGPLHDPAFIKAMQEECEDSRLEGVTSWKKIKGTLSACSEELNDCPLFFVLSELASRVRVEHPPLRKFKGALIKLGYRVSHFHKDANAIKTDAPTSVVYDVLRTWAKANPPKKLLPIAEKILSVPISVKEEIIFEEAPVTAESAAVARVPMFLPNPEKNWGPKKAAPIRAEVSAEEPPKKIARTEKTDADGANAEVAKVVKETPTEPPVEVTQ